MDPKKYTFFVLYRNRYAAVRGGNPCDVAAELCDYQQDTTDLDRIKRHWLDWKEVHNEAWEPLYLVGFDLRDEKDLLLATLMAIGCERLIRCSGGSPSSSGNFFGRGMKSDSVMVSSQVLVPLFRRNRKGTAKAFSSGADSAALPSRTYQPNG